MTAESSTANVFSFAEIVQGRKSTVHLTNDRLLCAVDLVMVLTGKDMCFSAKILRRLGDNVFQSKLVDIPANGSGHPAKYISFHNAIELIMMLPDKLTKKTRVQFTNIIMRYLAGGQTPTAENNNTTGASPGVHMTETVGIKRKREELELLKLEQDIRAKEQDLDAKKQASIIALNIEYNRVCSSTNMDEGARLVFKDAFLGMVARVTKSFHASESCMQGNHEEDVQSSHVNEEELDSKTMMRGSAFSLKGLVERLDLKIDQAFMPAIGRAVSTKFSEMYPERETFSRKKTAYFYEKDRECLEKIVSEEYVKYVVRKADKKIVVTHGGHRPHN
jgi:hypothetical protein